jgi:cytochrome c-type biogenesis protein CcmH/NrfG
LGHDFVWDDFEFIVENPLIRNSSATPIADAFLQDFGHTSSRSVGYYRPLVTLSYYADYRIFKGNPLGFHFVNITLNTLTCVAAFFFVWQLFGSVLFAFVAVLLFAVHPVHTEAVAWVSGRTDVLATFWSMVSLTFYVLARRRSSIGLLACSLLALMLGLLSKELAVVVPFVIVLLEFTPMREGLRSSMRSQRRRKRCLGRWGAVATSFGVLAIYLVLRHHAIGTLTSTYPAATTGVGARVALVFSIFGAYVYKALVPFNLSAEFDAHIPRSFADAYVLGGLAAAVGLSCIIWRLRRRAEAVLGVAFFALGILPVLNVVPIGEVSAERFLYFPSFGIALILGRIFVAALRAKYTGLRDDGVVHPGSAWSGSASGILVLVLGVVVAGSAVRTVIRNADWKNGEALFTKTVAQEPSNARAFASLGAEAERRGDIGAAVGAYRRALELRPDYAIVLSSLAGIHVRRGEYEAALGLIQKAIASDPTDPELLSNLGSIYFETGRYQEAARVFEKAIEIDPGELRAHFNLGLTLVTAGDSAVAREHFEKAATGGPDFNMALYYLALIEKAAGDRTRAASYARRFLARHPQDDEFRSRALLLLQIYPE